jgi:RNA polymerase sigma factor (sigma-70 family)
MQVAMVSENNGAGGTECTFGLVPDMQDAAPSPARERATVELLARQRPALWRTARRFSICADDADDAVQRAALIVLTKGPPLPPNRLLAWASVVTKHEALAVRRARERSLGVAHLTELPADVPGPAELAERSELVLEARRRLSELKANERLAILLQAEGYSYAEICDRCGWTYTKLNRCLAEGRAQLRAS